MSSSESDQAPHASSQHQTVPANTFERRETDAVEEVPATEDEG